MPVLVPYAGSVLKVALTVGLLAFRPGEKWSASEDRKASIAFIAGAAGLAAISPTIQQLAHNLSGPKKALADVPRTRLALPRASRTHRGTKPTKTNGPTPAAGGKSHKAVFAISMCVLVAGGQAAMVLGQGSSSSSSGEVDEDSGGIQDDPADAENVANESGGDSSAPGDAPDAPDYPDGDQSDKIPNDAYAGKGDMEGSPPPPPPPPPSGTISSSDDSNKGYKIYSFDWNAVLVALAVIIAFKKFKARRAMEPDNEDLGPYGIDLTQDALEVQENSEGRLRDGIHDHPLATAASYAAVTSSKYSNGSQFTDLSTISDDKHKELALICDLATPSILGYPGEVGMCSSEFGPSVDSVRPVDIPWEWANDHGNQPPVELHFMHSPKDAMDQIIASGSGSPMEESKVSSLGYHYGDQMKSFIKHASLVILLTVIAYLSFTIDHLNAAIEADEQASRQPVMIEESSLNDIEEDGISHDVPSEMKVTENPTTAKFTSNAAIVSRGVGEGETNIEEPEQTAIIIPTITQATTRKRSDSAPAVFSSHIKSEVAVTELISSSKSLATHINPNPMNPAPVSPAIETCPPVPTAEEIPLLVPTVEETPEVFAIPVVGGERPRRRPRGGRRTHTRAARGLGDGQMGTSSMFV